MAEPYYRDESVTLYHGDALEVASTLPTESVNLLLTDPPYFQVRPEDWDRQWKNVSKFLEWMGSWMDAVQPALTASASLYVFASPELTRDVEQLMAERWSLLSTIRWLKSGFGWHNALADQRESLRDYISPWEGIVFAEERCSDYADTSTDLHRQVFAPIGGYIRSERERAGWEQNDLEVSMGFVRTANPRRGTELVRRWEEGSSLPTADAYLRMRDVLNRDGGTYLKREWAELKREWEELRIEFESLRRPFTLSDLHTPSDIWNYPILPTGKRCHPCQKPLVMLDLMITASSRPGDTVLDVFAGSGSTLEAARNCGRKAIGVEVNEHYCELIAKRLAQGCLDFGDAS